MTRAGSATHVGGDRTQPTHVPRRCAPPQTTPLSCPVLLNHNRSRILTFLPSQPQPTSPTATLAATATSFSSLATTIPTAAANCRPIAPLQRSSAAHACNPCPLLPIVGPMLLSSAHLSPVTPSHALRYCPVALSRTPSFLICHRPTLLILLLYVDQPSAEHNQHCCSFHSSRSALFLHCCRPPPFEAPTTSLPCCSPPARRSSRRRCLFPGRYCPRCRSRFQPHPLPLHVLAATTIAPCSSLGCRSNRCPSLPLPPLTTTTASPSPTSFSTYW
ncbi:hypothetical protein B296_00024045 [Ensete ventricosum]|uniref:Uncharacterized protein n=1 Tax=Ensete ventricosum TaxID=4639 RepID=A0A427AVC8_ENSVE|nr:hypothetical protein B296_00024045 [Ensete ventricosum]